MRMKELTNSIADFVPIYSDQSNTTVKKLLERKLKEAQLFAPINAKLKENQEIMERLSRL